jgi:putative membrane protein
VNTSNTVFALVALGQPRTGVLVAFERSGASTDLSLLLVAVVLAATVAAPLVAAFGDRYLDLVGRVDVRLLSVSVLCLLAVLSPAFAGPVGVELFGLATLVGLVPPALSVRRVHLMRVLIGPLAL